MPSKILKKSGKKKNAKAGKKWNDNEMVVLLAWADHNLELDPTSGWQRFCETVETHLQEACGHLRTQAQILGKVDRIWKPYGRDGSQYPNLIKVEGSRCLENPDFVWHEAIDKRKKVLAHVDFVEQLSTRTTRSASKPGNRHLGPYRSALKLDLETSPLLRKRARDISGPQKPRPKTRSASRKRIQEAEKVAADGLLKQERWHTQSNTPQRQHTIQDSFSECTPELESGSENEYDSSTRPIPDQDSLVLSSKSSRQIESAVFSKNPQSQCRPGTANASTQVSFVAEIRQAGYYSEEHFRTQQEKYEAKIAVYATRLKAKEDEAKRYEQQLDALRLALQAHDRGQDLVKQLAGSKSKVKTLKNTLADRRLLQPFSRLASNQPVLCDYGFVNSEMDLIGGEVNSLARLDDTQVLDFSAIAKTSDSAQLMLRAFPGIDISGGEVRDLTDKAPLALKLNEFIRTLVGAAVCCWVFESPLNYMHNSSPCRLCSQYRTCLEIQDGPIALRNLDFAAHTCLLEEAVFQGPGVRAEAEHLTSKLCGVLRPLFARQEHMGIVLQSSLYKPSESGLDDMERLQKIFETALRVKAKLLLSSNVFEAVMYAPGTPFSKAKMTQKSSPGIPAKIAHSQRRPEIVCCYLPALVEHQASKTLVDNNNFVRSVPADENRLNPFTQAVVLL